MIVVEVVASALLVLGAMLAVIAALGLQRFRDVFARMHAATKPATLGLVLVLGGAALTVGGIEPVTKLVLVIMLQFITAPVGAHLVGRATFRAGTELDPDTTFDEESERIRPDHR
jgi:multicomponent Na+:H+ antiporter subunit G